MAKIPHLCKVDHSLQTVLSKYIPDTAVDVVVKWILEHQIKVRITKNRASKLGDYMPPQDGRGHRISINHNLNKFAFLVTFTHEVAHLKAHIAYHRNHAPHGPEWKHEFKKLLYPIMHEAVFPADVVQALQRYILDPAASSCSDIHLTKVLKKYDERIDNQTVHLADIPENTLFMVNKNLILKKGPLVRTRYRCTRPRTTQVYMVSPVAEVVIISSENN